jgi:hypothetical protein
MRGGVVHLAVPRLTDPPAEFASTSERDATSVAPWPQAMSFNQHVQAFSLRSATTRITRQIPARREKH